MDIETRLQAALFRVDCPTPIELGDYHLGLLAGDQAAKVGRHVQGCPHCAAEIAQLQTFLADVGGDLLVSPTERLRVWFGRLLPSPGGGSGLRPALAVRGDDRPPLSYEVGPAQIMLEVEQDATGEDRRTLVGLIVGAESSSLTAVVCEVDGQPASPLRETPVDDLGGFTLEGVPVGTYDLLLLGSDVEYHIQGLDVV
jgi:hypothetical protein